MKFVLCGRSDGTTAECTHEPSTPCWWSLARKTLVGQAWGLQAIASEALGVCSSKKDRFHARVARQFITMASAHLRAPSIADLTT